MRTFFFLSFTFFFLKTWANHPAVTNEYLVKIKPDANLMLKETLAAKFNAQNVKPIKSLHGWYKVKTKESLNSLSSNPKVEYVEPNYIYYADKSPSDSNYKYQWGIKNLGQKDNDGKVGKAGIDIDIEDVWDVTVGSPSVVIAVIDTGIDGTHKDLVGNLWVNEKELNGTVGVDDDGNGFVDDIRGYNFVNETPKSSDDHGHGTHCAGVIGAKGDNKSGIAGVNWKIKLMSVKFLNKDGSGTLEGALNSIAYATDNGAKVLSNSWGGGGESKAMRDMIEYSMSKGVLFVAAAGNRGENTDVDPHFPSSYDLENIISVAALDNRGDLADFSNFGISTVDIAAPGVNVISTLPGDVYSEWSGTSMATPFVSGVAGLILSVSPNMDWLGLKNRILSTARPIDTLKSKVLTGGLLNTRGAVLD